MTDASTTIATVPRGWHRPVRPVALVLVGAAVLVVWGGLMLAATWVVYERWDAILTLRDQPVTLRLPAGMEARADVALPVRTRLDLAANVTVPIDQTLAIEVGDGLQARTRLTTRVPIDTVVHVAQVVPVRTSLQLSVPVVRWLPDFHVTVPVTLDLPIRLDVPVKLEVPLDLDLHASGELRAPVRVPLKADLAVRPEIHAPLQVGLSQQMAFRLSGPMPPMPLRIEQARLRLPFSQPRLRRHTPEGEPALGPTR